MSDSNVPKETTPASFRYGFHCLAYLDILGQRRKLRQFPRLPADDPATRQLLKETAGVVIRLRDLARTCFEALQTDTPITPLLPPNLQHQLKEAKASIKTRGFSDSFVMWVTLSGDQEQLRSITGVYSSMAACCLLHLTALCERRPIRGGIEIGPGLELSEDEVYGSVLERAHFIESQLADYPRIVVGEELLRYLEVVGLQARTTPTGRIVESLAARARGLVTQDTDGLWVLDFLGEAVSQLSKTPARQHLFTKAQEYIEEQKQIAYDGQDYKHLSRYFRLGNYFESRAIAWNASDTGSQSDIAADSPPKH